jgi:hypothetical protein
MANIKNVVTGVYDTVPDHYLEHPILGKDLILAEDEAPAAPKNKTTKEQPAPEAEPAVVEPETTK